MAGSCQGARLACSLQLDGELTVRGSERLARHLRCCASCRSFARELGAISNLLRDGLKDPGFRRVLSTRCDASNEPRADQQGRCVTLWHAHS